MAGHWHCSHPYDHLPSHQRRNAVHVDIHQHVWPDALVDELRRRSQPRQVDGWPLLTSGEPPFAANPAGHDSGRRALRRGILVLSRRRLHARQGQQNATDLMGGFQACRAAGLPVTRPARPTRPWLPQLGRDLLEGERS
jgi:hypothetical protein